MIELNKNNTIFFWGHTPKSTENIDKSCLSQWYPCDFKNKKNNTFHNAEQFMMAEKALLFQDEEIYDKILLSFNPKTCKELGRKVKNFNQNIWDNKKLGIVMEGNYLKFSQNTGLKDYLLSTDDKILVEASPYDRIWGIGLSEREDHEQVNYPYHWKGQNLLGFALMSVRAILK